jgi:hypothetical protein
MKNLRLVSVFVVCLLVLASSVNATGYRTDFKDYEIEMVDDLKFGKNVDKVWTLTYNSSNNPVTVVKHKTLDGAEYVVHSKFFEVSYAATSNGFGAKTVRRSWRSVPNKINNVVLSQEQMKKQEVITPKEVDDERALGLIASFLPELINDNYTHVLN